MAEKLKVRDLANELGVGNKELLTKLRELDIQVKSFMSSLTEEEAALVRSEMATHQGTTEVVRKEVQPGVIVRRRKKGGRTERQAPPAETPAPEAAKEAEAPEAAGAAPEKAPAPKAEPVEAPAADKPARIVTPKAEPKPAGARVVVRPDEEPAQQPQQAEETKPQEAAPAQIAAEQAPAAAEMPVPPADKPAEPEVGAQEPVPSEAQADAETEAPKAAAEPEKPAAASGAEAESGEDSEAQADAKAKPSEKFSGSQVRVIAKAEPRPARPAQQRDARPARPGRPGGFSGPGGPGGPGGPRPAQPGAGAPGEPAGDSDGGRKRKKKKDRRTVSYNGEPGMQSPDGKRHMDGPGGDRPARGRPRKKGRGGRKQDMPEQQTTAPMKAAKRKLRIEEAIRVSDMAHQMGIKAPEIIRVLMGLGVMATINASLDIDTATVVAGEFGYEVEKVGFAEEDYLPTAEPDKEENLKPRPPVVTIMGHVDHGKTSLLDAIRTSKVTEGEAGGITQHIGAYHVPTDKGEIVFLDTPGHEAFTAMRARGAKVTDLVILVVAADDGVMDQTREAVSHSKAAGVPIVVAVNKMDKEGANPERVQRELAEMELVPEDWGGDTMFVPVSAKQKTGIDDLLDMVLLQSEVLELQANPDKLAKGHIVEAKLDKGRGPLGTVLVQEGTLKQGDSFVCGLHYGKVRAMFDDQGNKIPEAGPSIPVEVQGFDGVPGAGDEFTAVADDKVARRIAEARQLKQREADLAKQTKVTLESFLQSKPSDAEVQTLGVVLKADVQGSLEAISEALIKCSTDAVKIDIIHSGAGGITESDIMLARASEAIIIGFNVRATAKIREVAEHENVEIRYYDIIYKLVEDIKDAMAGMLAPVITEQYLGQAEVRETFSVPKVGTVAGCAVVDGKLARNAPVRLLRDGVVIYTGTLNSLRRFKDDVKEVAKGYECGVGLERFNDIKVGDVIEAFEEVETKATLE